MRKFSGEMAVAAIELEQLVMDYWREVDDNDARGIRAFYTPDCVAQFGPSTFAGHDGIEAFYAGRRTSIAAQQGDTPRTGRHVCLNLQIVMNGDAEASLRFLICTFAGRGPIPVLDATLPSALSEGRFEARRVEGGTWRITGFYGSPLFVGSDPLARQSAMGQTSP